MGKKWLSAEQNQELIAGVERELEADREFAVNSPMPEGKTADSGVYCDAGCHEIKVKYGLPKVSGAAKDRVPLQSEAALHFK